MKIFGTSPFCRAHPRNLHRSLEPLNHCRIWLNSPVPTPLHFLVLFLEWMTSPDKLETILPHIQSHDIERYSDSLKPRNKRQRESLSDYMKLHRGYFPQELLQGMKPPDKRRRVKWKAVIDDKKLAMYEALERRAKEKDGDEKDEDDDEEENDGEEDDEEFSDEGDYELNEDFDEDEDDFNDNDDGGDLQMNPHTIEDKLGSTYKLH